LLGEVDPPGRWHAKPQIAIGSGAGCRASSDAVDLGVVDPWEDSGVIIMGAILSDDAST
jgi:hypothetical protein